ncbi:MAG: hypothetical protein ACX939_06975 [Hyphococcus sp.]
MANISMAESKPAHAGERSEYRLYFIAAYPFFLMAAIAGRFLPGAARRKARGLSVFEEAAESAHSVIPWIFSGR